MRVISDIAYGKLVDAEDPTEGRRLHALRAAWLMFRASKHADLVFTNEGKRTPPGLILLAFLLWTSRRRVLVLSEFLPGTRTGLKGRLVTRGYRFLLPRVLVAAQLMTDWEREDYAARYGIPAERLHVIPFYYFDDRVTDVPQPWDPNGRSGYLSTGKNACDWGTLIRSAEGEDWPLTIISRRAEYEQIKDDAERVGVLVEHDVPRARHDQMLATSSLLVVALKEKSVSAGHVRLMTAATHGTPVVLTGIKGVRGYEMLAADVVPPSDPVALRTSVNRIMSDPDGLRERMEAVRVFASARPYSRYAAEIREFIALAAS